MLTRTIFQTRLPVIISVANRYETYQNYRPAKRQFENSTGYLNKRIDRSSSEVSSGGYLSESQWFERLNRNLEIRSLESCNKLKEQPVNIICGDIEYNTWDKFSEIDDIDSRISEVLIKAGHDQMTQIQKNTFDILNRQLMDLLGSAETGSGKTIAYLSPLLNNVLKHYPKNMMQELQENNRVTRYPLVLVLAPTRELVQQISIEAKKLLQLTHLRAVNIIGGANALTQIHQINNGCHALIATPGRLKDLTQRGVLSLKYCNKLVIDEADRMLDMGFEPQIREIMEQFDLPSENQRHTSMFSATFPSSVMDLARSLMKKNYGQVMVGKNAGSSETCIPESIEQNFVLTDNGSLYRECFKFIQQTNKKTIVFCNKKVDVDIFFRFARNQNLKVAGLHGGLSQNQRDTEFKLFKSNEAQILVATSVAARGIDVADVECVINLGLPLSIDEYMHRVGRCGRMGRPGIAMTFVLQNDLGTSNMKDLIKMLHRTQLNVPDFMNSQSEFRSTQKKFARRRYDDDNFKSYSNRRDRYSDRFMR